ncbi:hypothetical protein SLS56_005168 [Neofusicoccum ribis]|uniref:PNPLA domain-containing protein n=1 Tax=Neofusicoccum ribis TaxID=45134 RepID=A0ABR3SV36_9PEZI
MSGIPWIATSLTKSGRWRLVDNAGALHSLSLSKAQTPDFVTLVGGHSKARLLQQLVAAPPLTPLGTHGQVHLRTEPRSCRSDIPRIFIDCEAHHDQPSTPLAEAQLGPQHHREITWANRPEPSLPAIAHKLYARVLGPLSSVICYFAADLGGLRGVAKLIADQLVSGPPHLLQSEAIPRVLVVVDTSSSAFDASVAEARLLGDVGAALHELSRDPRDLWPNLLTRFHEVRVLGLQKHDSSEVRAKILRRRIVAISGSAHAARRASRTLLSAGHSVAFFGHLIENFCAGDEPLDFIKASRPLGFSLKELPMHLGELFGTFGTPSRSEKYTFSLESCLLCGESDSSALFSFVPPTAGIRILSLDGGGIRGVIELAILRKVHNEFSSLRLPFADYFDYVCGTSAGRSFPLSSVLELNSAGGLIILGLFLMRWTPDQCLDKFEKLAAQTFKRPERPSSFSRLRQTLLSYVKDCKYESTTIEDTFRTLANNAPNQLFNPLKSETKVAVTTTTAREVLPCLFANYNGRCRPQGIGYQIVRAQKPQDDVLIHEAFFKPKVLENLGTFQDGGLQHNNPLGIALCEYRYIWPDKGEPDFALSVGSGTNFNDARAVFEPQSPVQDGTLRRLFQSFMRNTDGEKAWRDFINTLSENLRHRYHRLNINMEGQEPDIDDVSSMERLRRQAEKYINSSLIIKPVRDAMFASMFYFELEDIPVYRDGSYLCIGVIFCRMNLCKEARKAFYEDLISSPSYFLIDGQPIRCVETIPRENA